MDHRELREEICQVGRMLWERGLVGALEGNISARISEDELLCTPAGRNKGMLKPEDLVRMNLDGVPLDGGVPSSEVRLHLECYTQRADCMAVVHAHPPIATAFALAREPIPDNLLPEAAIFLGSVALVPFGMPGTDEMRHTIQPFLADHKTFLLSNHGAVVLGKDLEDAFKRMETLERVATVIYYATQIGTPQPLPDHAFSRLLEIGLHGRLD